MLKLAWDNRIGAARLQRDQLGALALDYSLETSVTLALFTDAEATAEEIRAAGLELQRGWWAEADTLRDANRPRMGSKLWLLARGKTTLETLRRAEVYAREALQWLVNEGVAVSVDVLASRPRPHVIALDVTIRKPQKLLPAYRRLWEFNTDVI